MKVSRGGKRGESFASASSASNKNRTEKSNFVEAINNAIIEGTEKDLDELTNKINTAAENLINKRTASSLDEYKSFVTSFMKLVIDKAMKVKEIPSVRFMETNKVFMIATKVEEKLLELAEKIKEGKSNAIDVAATTSEIRGWLFDMRI